MGADIPDDAFLKAAFVGGLRAEFQDWVVPQVLETLEDAVALALSLERAESVREARRVAKAACAAAGRCSFCDAEGHEEAQCEVRVRMKKLWRSSSGRGGGAAAAKDGERAEEEWGGGNMALARLASAASARSTQCQCRKHQCGKKATASLWQWNSEAVAFCPALQLCLQNIQTRQPYNSLGYNGVDRVRSLQTNGRQCT